MISNFLFFKSQKQHFYSKYKNGVLRIIANHFLISAVVALAIILTLPSIFDKYIIEITSREKIPPNSRYYYADCNDDGVSEKIEFRQLENDHFSLTVFEKNRTIDQWNFKGKYFRMLKAIVAKTASDSTSSIYFFVLLNNKIYLNCLNPFANKFSVRDKFVIDYTPINQELDTELSELIFFDYNKDGVKEFYFLAETAYSKQPRRVFKYDPANDTILMSAKSYAAIVPNSTIIDTADNDLKFIFASHALGNSKLTDPYSDMFAWLMCIDTDLKLKNEPLRIGFYPSMSKIISIIRDKKKYFVCLNI